ncbi:MAG: hypothetical protein CVU46_03385 [Chloroflexi bacterium HGW-Chloroflexi-8]|nr:MAG: hypothetical protein CVU46_03385 [Chloroflexi bacterium HGW-Chloroflexi-8]
MKRNHRLGGILTIIGAVMGIVGHYVLFFQWYVKGMSAESAEPGCEILLKYIHPGLADLGILGAVILLVSSYGFFCKKNWAFLLSVIGIVCALLASWFINVPFMAASLPPVYFPLFFPYLLIYFLLLRSVERISWSRTLLALGFGLAYIFCFMNGVSSTSRIITIGAPIFVVVDALHWVAMIGWAVITVGILMSPKEWMQVVGLTSGVLELAVGIPLAVVTAQQLGRFSLFALAPITCLILIAILVWPGLWQKWSGTA